MRKQARRLWLGDWQREEEPARSQPVAADRDEADTFVITPLDDEEARGPAGPRRKVKRGAILAAIAAVCALVFVLSSGGNDKSPTSERSDAPLPQAQPQIPQTQI